jgi:NAD(P)-dependent dehydrogenase (short-subunit alcohol dehydrogenase family)
MKEFKGKVAVITGAASGIGRAIAERCVREGMTIVLADIEEASLAKRRDGTEVRGRPRARCKNGRLETQ